MAVLISLEYFDFPSLYFTIYVGFIIGTQHLYVMWTEETWECLEAFQGSLSPK